MKLLCDNTDNDPGSVLFPGFLLILEIIHGNQFLNFLQNNQRIFVGEKAQIWFPVPKYRRKPKNTSYLRAVKDRPCKISLKIDFRGNYPLYIDFFHDLH